MFKIKFKETTGRLHQAWDKYVSGDMTASQLLRECGGIYGATND
jgi:hypothetical protein